MATAIWTGLVLFTWIVVSLLAGDDDCGEAEAFCTDNGDLFLLFAVPAGLVWLVGLLVIWIRRPYRDTEDRSR